MPKNEEKMHLPSVDDFFTTQEERDNKNSEVVKKISIKDISNFPNHPYQIREDEEMEDMVNSIKEMGVLHPILVRPKQDGGYEMISGHRRKRACEKAGITEITAIVREMTDDEAVITMVDCNKQREKILPSEKAFAYKMKLEAMKRQGKRNDLTSVPSAQKLEGKTSREILGEEVGESQDQIRRYIRLTELIPELLELVDKEKDGIALRPAVEISYLKEDEQYALLDAIECLQVTPSHAQAIIMRKRSNEGTLTVDKIDEILEQEKANQIPKIKLNEDRFLKVLPPNLKNAKEREDYIFHCVEVVRSKELKQQREQAR